MKCALRIVAEAEPMTGALSLASELLACLSLRFLRQKRDVSVSRDRVGVSNNNSVDVRRRKMISQIDR